jgi:bifunctional DNA-binding transcriptional regulator/antitoxin component of YhaV-PrlF toxin-antitoxin module
MPVDDSTVGLNAVPMDGENIMATPNLATLSTKFQISMPKAVRTARQWQAGQLSAFIPKGVGMLLVPVPRRDDLTGFAKNTKAKNYPDRTDRI